MELRRVGLAETGSLLSKYLVYQGVIRWHRKPRHRARDRPCALLPSPTSYFQASQQIVASSEPAWVDGVLVEPRWGRMLLDLYADLDPARQQTLAETRMADVGDLVKEWNA